MTSEIKSEHEKILSNKNKELPNNELQHKKKENNENEEEAQYKQIQPTHRSYSEPTLLSSRASEPRANSDVYMLKEFSNHRKTFYHKGNYSSLFVLGPENPIRNLAILITESKAFDYFILLAILFTCVVMAIDAPLPESDKSQMNKISAQIENYLLGIFCFEAVLKIIAMGFVLHPHSYLRSIWNVLDFVVVVTGIITLDAIAFTKGKNLNIKALRAVRVLRPLKLISGIPSLQVVMTSIVRAIFPLLQVLFLVVFVIVIYAIIGLEFFAKRFHYSCKDNVTLKFDEIPCDYKITQNETFYVYGRRCPPNSTCTRGWAGLNYGITSFDNIFLAMITVFQCITMEGWTEIMYNTFYVMDEHGYLWTIYYVSLIVIGSFFMLNLVLGVLSGEFAKEREKVENRREFLKLRYAQQLERVCEGYLAWILKGEDAIVQEMSDETFQTNNTENENSEGVIANPALVFTTSHDHNSIYGKHRKSKIDRLKIYIKLLRVKTRVVVKHNIFFWVVVSMVFINTVIMATRHYMQPEWLRQLQETAEIVFVVIFTFEVLIKVFAYEFIGFCKSLFNIFDLVVIALSILEIILGKLNNNINFGLSVLRCLRLLRIFKVTKYWSSLRNLVTSLMNAMKSILSLMFLLLLFIVISSLLGMQLFGGRFVKLEKFPRTNFDTFQDSLLAVFQVITGEDWNVVMYNGIMAYGGPKNVIGVLCSLYFIFLVIFGNYTLLNVFLAIAVDNLTNAEILTHDEEAEEKKKQETKLLNTLKADPKLNKQAFTFVNKLQSQALDVEMTSFKKRTSTASNSPSLTLKDEGSIEDIHENGHVNGDTLSPSSPTLPVVVISTPDLKRRKPGLFEQAILKPPSPRGSVAASPEKYKIMVQKKWLKIIDANTTNPEIVLNNNIDGDKVEVTNDGEEVDTDEEVEDEEDIEKEIKEKGLLNVIKVNVTSRRRILRAVPMIQHSSLYILSPKNSFRVFCHKVVNFRCFDWFIMGVILLSSITLALEDPVNDKAKINKVFMYFDYFFTSVFGLEVFLKIIDLGLVVHKGSYLRNPWNVLDAVVFTCNLTSILLSQYLESKSTGATQIVKTLRVLRVLRPLKAIHKVKKLKAVFQCMIYSLKNVTFVLIITCLILFIFACIGVQLFQGKFYYCTDQSKMTEQECQGSYYDFPQATSVVNNEPEVKKRIWKRYDFHFDDIYNAFLTLYTCSTGEGWPNSMHQTIDSTQIGHGPVTNNKPHMSIYYIVFVVIFTFMIINIYIALIILTFQRQGEKEIEGGLVRNQRDCLQFVLNANPRQKYIPANKDSWSYRVWFVVDSSPFEYFIMVLIILNTIQLMMKYDGNPESYTDILRALNIAFTCLFCIEACLKIIAYRQSYFRDFWNLFDLGVILGSLLDIILSEKSVNLRFIDPSMFRLCRAARIIKLLRKGDSIRVMLWTFVQSFKALPYVTALIMLLFYIYAIIGMQMFGKIDISERNAKIHEYNNFRTIIQALQVLFRCSTGESWNELMTACYDRAKCDSMVKVKEDEGCGNTWVSQLYFSTFIFFCMFLLLNLFVAVIMDNFEYLTRDNSILGPHHLDEFVRCWSEFDPTATGYIPHEELYRMMCHLTPPIGFGKKCPKNVAYKRLIRMNMPVRKDGSVTFYTTLLSLIRVSLDVYVRGNMFDNDEELKRVIKSIWPKTTVKVIDRFLPRHKHSDQQLTVGKIYCAKLLVINYRNRGRNRTDSVASSSSSAPSMLSRINSILPSSFRRHKLPKRLSTDVKGIQLRSLTDIRRHKTYSAATGRRAQNDPHHTRDNQLRRRSSWSDLPSFFRFNNKESSASANDVALAKDQSTHLADGGESVSKSVTYTTSGGSLNKTSTLSPTYGKNKPKSVTVNRSPSLRTNSNGNVINTTHRRVSSNNSVHSLQLDSISKSSSVRYQPNNKLVQRIMYTNSAPPTPRGTHAPGLSPLTRQNVENRNHNQSSPLPRRVNTSIQSLNTHRRGSSHPNTNFIETARDPRYTNNFKPGNNNYNDLRYGVEFSTQYDPRPRSTSDPRTTSNQRKYTQQQMQARQELSKENLETFNHYGQYESSDRRDVYRNNNSRQKYVQDIRVGQVHPDSRVVSFNQHDDSKYSLHEQQRLLQEHRVYPKTNAETNFKPIDPNYRDSHLHYNDRNEHEYHRNMVGDSRSIPNDNRTIDHRTDHRNMSGDMINGNRIVHSPQKQLSNVYRHENDNKLGTSYVINKNGAVDQKGLHSPRRSTRAAGGRASPSHHFNDNDLLNGAPSQQYYDTMISQINHQIARVSESGSSSQHSSYNSAIQNAPPTQDDDGNEWC